MEQIYVIMLAVLGILAFIDISVGVSNDAVNFMNSSLGSKAISFKTAIIIASVGMVCGALFSNGMMEIARKGIFTPELFSFHEVMIIFLAVMISDILLLDVFNSLGLPTSTTVSVVFELLGAAVCLATIKVIQNGEVASEIMKYINTEKATQIIVGIFLSVAIAFIVGSLVQYITRLIFTFKFKERMEKYGALFGGIAITFITFFILIKGLKGVSFITKAQEDWIKGNQLLIIGMLFVFWTLMSMVLIKVFKQNILKVIIVIGTFALALAFAGNDLVNFIGVPIAGYEAYKIFINAGVGTDPHTLMMGGLASSEIKANFYFLILAGIFMVYTLATSKKAKTVIETELNLSRQGDGVEKFSANAFGRILVKAAVNVGEVIDIILPKTFQLKLDERFAKEEAKISRKERNEAPAFDMLRASINLIVASILIAMGTSLKLPLSTTYVTFMVAMGTSFADRAWDRDSAVYRVSGVFNVIGGWFGTAIIAFITSMIIAVALYYGDIYAFIGIIILLVISLYRSNKAYKTKQRESIEAAQLLSRTDIVTIQEVMKETSIQISSVINKSGALYSETISGLSKQDEDTLKKNKKKIKKLEKEQDELKANIYYFIKNLDDTSVEASKFYVHTLGYLQDVAQSLSFITLNSYAHVVNNHKKLKFNQIKDIRAIDKKLNEVFNEIEAIFNTENYEHIDRVVQFKEALLKDVERSIEKQITRIRTTETSPKNSKLYFNILLETNDLIKAVMNLLLLFKELNEYIKIRNS